MKKRNWLMTIAFAVLSLTIISTCVIGSTYAKFVSKVNGSGKAQAAGFLIVAGKAASTSTEENVLMAPGVKAGYKMTINYFSQVVTNIKTVEGADNGATGTGVFAAANWTKLVTFYNAHIDEIKAATGAEGAAVDASLKYTSLIEVVNGDGKAIDEAFVAAVVAKNSALAVSDNAKQLKAMAADATEAIAAELTVTAEWKTHAQGGDLFDNFIGNCIAAFEQGTTLKYGDAEIIADAASETAIAKTAKGTLSEVGIAVNIVAEQAPTGAGA